VVHAVPHTLEDSPVPPEFEPVAVLGELAEGTVLQRVRASGEAICLVRHRDQVSAVSDICTHQHFSMSHGDILGDGSLQCAWHGARFDCLTGEVREGPAESPLPIFAVRIEGSTILVGPRSERRGPRYEVAAAKVE
jgi:nitrite reductase/ring-hydroxylating ferredoxin subunit